MKIVVVAVVCFIIWDIVDIFRSIKTLLKKTD